MGRGRRSKQNTNGRNRESSSRFASGLDAGLRLLKFRPLPYLVKNVVAPSVGPLLASVDRRRYIPQAYQTWRTLTGRVAKVRYAVQNPLTLATRPLFAVPKQVVSCVRRKMRKEVLHALGLAGRKGQGGGKKHWKDDSHIKC